MFRNDSMDETQSIESFLSQQKKNKKQPVAKQQVVDVTRKRPKEEEQETDSEILDEESVTPTKKSTVAAKKLAIVLEACGATGVDANKIAERVIVGHIQNYHAHFK